MKKYWINFNLTFFWVLILFIFVTAFFGSLNTLIHTDTSWDASGWIKKVYTYDFWQKTYSINWKWAPITLLLVSLIVTIIIIVGMSIHLFFTIRYNEKKKINIIIGITNIIIFLIISIFLIFIIFGIINYKEYLNGDVLNSLNVWTHSYKITNFVQIPAGILALVSVLLGFCSISSFVGYYIYNYFV